MTQILLKPTLLIFIFPLILYVNALNCNKIYMAPISIKGPYLTSDVKSFKTILNDCLKIRKKNTFVTTLDFFYKTSFSCLVNKHGDGFDDACVKQYGRNDVMALNKNESYGIKNFIDEEIIKDEECGENALIIFINFIPCEKFPLYPDLDELFGSGLEMTQKYLLEKNLHYLVMLIHHQKIELEACNKTMLYLNFTKTSNIRVKTFNSRFLTENDAGSDVCQTYIPTFPEDYHDNTVKQDSIVSEVAISITSGIVLLLILLFVAFWSRQIYRRWQESKIEAFANEHVKSARHLLFGKYRDEWEVTPKELKIDSSKIIGKGAFGVVYKGHLKKQRGKELVEMDVAVKFTTEYSTEQMRQDMIREIGFMKALGSHKNLLVMVGYVKSIENPMICTIFCENGDLLQILRQHHLHFMGREKCNAVKICLLLPDLLRISIEICNGLCYLSSLNYVHRDIAARNVLLTNQLVAKLSDFGLCKKLEFDQKILIEKDGKFPIKHMPHESLKFGEFSEKSDVWSFGMLLWEIFSGGKVPFEKTGIKEFVDFLENDGKPVMSEKTPQPLICLLNEKVFQKYPSRRANFIELKKELSNFYSIVCNVLLMEEKSGSQNSSRNSSFKSIRKRL